MKEFYNPSNSGSPAYALHNLHADGFSIVNKSSFNLWCKVTNDFHILLKKDENEYNSNVIEIVIGGWGNSKSVIRNAQQGTNRDTYQVSGNPPVIFIAGRPTAALLFWFFGDFRCGALLFMVIYVIYKYKNR